MLLKIDAAQLEFRVKAFLAQDQKAIEEIWLMEDGKYDIHTDNQTRFVLPNRTIAKNWLYQAIFCDAFGPQGLDGAAGGFAAKADFQHVFQGTRKQQAKEWLGVLERFFEKYNGVYSHGPALIQEATNTGRIIVPSGRFFPFTLEPCYGGGLDWPRTKIRRLSDHYEHLVLWLDFDKAGHAAKLRIKASPYFNTVRTVVTPKDPKDYSDDDIAQNLGVLPRLCEQLPDVRRQP